MQIASPLSGKSDIKRTNRQLDEINFFIQVG